VGTGIIIIDRDTLIIIEANQTAMEMTGLPKKRIIGQICHSLVCPAQAGKCPVKDLGQSVDNSERKLIHADGHLKDILKTVYPITIKGKDCYVESFIDITERKRAEEQVRQSLREKDLLLREVYHRTKNNMNVIIALLSMRGESSRDVTVAQTFKDIEDRIQAMALVHQKLYESRDLSNIDIREFVSDLAALLMRSHRISADDLTLVLEMDKVPVSIDVAMPCGMILTELFSNMFKHAFPDRRKGEVRLGIARAAGGEIELSYADNGIGVPAGFDFRSQPTLGLRTIFMLAEHQLQGEARFEGGRGVACRIRFNDANIPARFKS
jgi:PAS domain S-box-containing protein